MHILDLGDIDLDTFNFDLQFFGEVCWKDAFSTSAFHNAHQPSFILQEEYSYNTNLHQINYINNIKSIINRVK